MPNQRTFFWSFPIIFLLVSATHHSCGPAPNQKSLLALTHHCFRSLYDFRIYDGNVLSKLINDRLQNYKLLLQTLKMDDLEHIKTSPVVKWAQSDSQIYLSLKLSHRQDSPTCSDVREQRFNVSNIEKVDGEGLAIYHSVSSADEPSANKSSLNFESECYFTHQKFLFSLTLEFQHPISNLTILREGLGSYTLIGSKAVNQIWGEPFTNWKQAAIWAQIRNKFEKDMNQYFAITQEMFSSASKGKRKRNRKAKAPSSENETDTKANNEL